MGAANIEPLMKLRTRLNLVVAGLTAAFVIVLISAEVQATRSSIREEIEAANRVAAQLLGRLAYIYSSTGGPELVLPFLQQLGHVRANEIVLRSSDGQLLYRSPPPTYKSGRAVPAWFGRLMSPAPAEYRFSLPGDVLLSVEANPSRAVLDAWDDLIHLFALSTIMLVIFNGAAFWSVNRALVAFPVITEGLERVQRAILPIACRRSTASKQARSAPPSIAWRRRFKTSCRRSAKFMRRRRALMSGEKWHCSLSSASRRSGA